MSGSGKGVCTAVTISNAITNLYGKDTKHHLVSHTAYVLVSDKLILLMICSYSVWTESEVRAVRNGEEGIVEERNELSFIGMRLHSRIHP